MDGAAEMSAYLMVFEGLGTQEEGYATSERREGSPDEDVSGRLFFVLFEGM
jgi:hypothetical protein